MAAGLVTHNITTAAGVTFQVKSWVPDTSAPDTGAVPLAMLTDDVGNTCMLGFGTSARALRFTPASDSAPMTVLQGANNGGTWQIEGKAGGTGTLVPVHMDPAQLSAPGQLLTAASASVVMASDFGMPLATDKMVAGTASLTPKFATIAASASGDNSIIAAVAGKILRVLSLKVTASAAVNAKWRSATTDKTGLSYYAGAGDGEVLPFNPLGWFQTAAGEVLNVNLSAAVPIGGHLTYIEV